MSTGRATVEDPPRHRGRRWQGWSALAGRELPLKVRQKRSREIVIGREVVDQKRGPKKQTSRFQVDHKSLPL